MVYTEWPEGKERIRRRITIEIGESLVIGGRLGIEVDRRLRCGCSIHGLWQIIGIILEAYRPGDVSHQSFGSNLVNDEWILHRLAHPAQRRRRVARSGHGISCPIMQIFL